MADLYGPPLPAKIRKKAAPVAKGPIQPAFPAEEYLGNPWTKVMNGEMPNNIPPIVQVPVAAPAPAPIADTRIASSPFEVPNIETENGMVPQLNPNYLQRPTIGSKIGEAAKSSMNSTQNESSGLKQDLYMEGSQFQDLNRDIENTPAIQRMLAAQKARDQLAMDAFQNNPVQTDLSPLAALVDQWTGSKLAQSYKAPEGYSSRAKALLDYADKSQDDQQKLAQTILSGVQYLKAGSYQDQQARALAEMLGYSNENPMPRAAGGGRGRAASIDEKWLIGKADKLHNTYQEDKSQLQSLDNSLQIGDLQGVQIALGYASRQLGGQKGVLTDKDIAMTLPRTIAQDYASLMAYLKNNPNQQLPAEVSSGLRKLVIIAQQRLDKKYSRDFTAFKNSVANSSMRGMLPVLSPYEESYGAGAQETAKALSEASPKTEIKTGPSLKEMFQKRLDERMKQEKGANGGAKK